MSLSFRALKFENFNKQDISKNSNKIAVHVDITRGRVYAIKGRFFQLVVLSGKTPGRVLSRGGFFQLLHWFLHDGN